MAVFGCDQGRVTPMMQSARPGAPFKPGTKHLEMYFNETIWFLG
jgi:hypothetical protein